LFDLLRFSVCRLIRGSDALMKPGRDLPHSRLERIKITFLNWRSCWNVNFTRSLRCADRSQNAGQTETLMCCATITRIHTSQTRGRHRLPRLTRSRTMPPMNITPPTKSKPTSSNNTPPPSASELPRELAAVMEK
jgi:hypothetical protein